MSQGDYRARLHAATAPLHGKVDALFGRFDLSRPDGLARFLAAHAIGMRACQPIAARFAGAALGCAAPDYAGMLAGDLAMLGIAAENLPEAGRLPELGGVAADAGIFYVVAGSRMGTAVMRKQAVAITPRGPAHSACGYFAEGDGPAVWRLFRLWLGRRSELAATGTNGQELPAMIAAAQAGFELFAAAAELAEGVALSAPEGDLGDAA